jgi:hypothetical protein
LFRPKATASFLPELVVIAVRYEIVPGGDFAVDVTLRLRLMVSMLERDAERKKRQEGGQ